MTTPSVIYATPAAPESQSLLVILPSTQQGDTIYAVILGCPEVLSSSWFRVAGFTSSAGDTISILRRTSLGSDNATAEVIVLNDTAPVSCIVLVVRESSGRTHHITGASFTGSEGVTPPGTKLSDDLCLGFVASTTEINDIYVPDDVTVVASAYSDGNFCRLTVFEMESAGQTDVPSKTVRIGTATEGVAGYILIPGAR